LTVADATGRTITGAATATATSHLSTQDTASSAMAAATGSCNAAVVTPVSHRFVFTSDAEFWVFGGTQIPGPTRLPYQQSQQHPHLCFLV